MSFFNQVPERWKLNRIGTLFSENTTSNAELLSDIPMQFRFGEIVRKKVVEKDNIFLDSIRRYNVIQPNDIMVNGLNLNYDFVTQRVAIVREVGCMTPAYVSLRPKDSINPMYACYLLKAMDGQKILNGLGTGIRLTLGFSELKKTYIPLPPREEQNQIVRYLDWKVSQINKLINVKRQQIALLQEQKYTLVEETLSNITASQVLLRYLGTLQNGISEAGDFFTAGTPFVNYGDVYKNEILPSNVNGLAKASEKQQKTYSVEYGDIFFTRTSETIEEIGLTSVCAETIPQAIFSGFVIRFRPKNGIFYIPYAKYFFRSKRVRDYFIKEMNLVTRVSLGQTLLKNLPVLLPNLDEQRDIAMHLDKQCGNIDKIINKLNEEIALFTEYRTRVISDVVTGKLDVCGVVVPEYEAVEAVAEDIEEDTETTETENE